MDKKRNYILLMITVISLGLLLTGGTYAWLTFNGITVGNNTLTGNTSNFLMDYSASLTGTLYPSSTYEGGLSGTVTAMINEESSVSSAVGTLYLYADSNTSSILYEGTELGIALKYAVLSGGDVVESGTVNSNIIKTGVPNGMIILDHIPIQNTKNYTYTVYVWLDGNLVDNRYLDLSFSGSINLKAVQSVGTFVDGGSND